MARKKRTIKVDLIVDSKGSVRAVRTADGEILQLGDTVEKTDKKVKGLSNSIKLGLVAAMAGLALAARKGFRVLNESIQLAGIQQIAERKLEQALRNTGDASEESAEMLKGLAAELEKTSNFGDEMTLTAQAMLLSFSEVGGAKGAALLTTRLADVAAGVQNSTGQIVDLNTIAAALGKSLAGGAGSLREYGISLTKTQEKAFNTSKGLNKVRLLTEILDANFQGLAAATADPFIKANNAILSLKEALGKELRPELERTTAAFTEFIQDESTVKFVEKISRALLDTGRTAIEFFDVTLPLILKTFRFRLLDISQQFLETQGKVVQAIRHPFKFFGGEELANPFQGAIDQLESLKANAIDALAGLLALKKEASTGPTAATPGDDTPPAAATPEADPALQAEIKKIDVRKQAEGALTLWIDRHLALRRDMKKKDFKEDDELEKKRLKAIEARKLAMEQLVINEIALADQGIKSARDAALAVANGVRQVIQAKIAETIAKAIATIPFPANLILGSVAAAGINLLFNKLIPGFADGVTGFSGGVALVGERGPELVSMPQGSNVITNENTEKLISSVTGAGMSGSTEMVKALQAHTDAMADMLERLGVDITSRPVQAKIDPFHLKDEMGRFNRQQSSLGNTAPFNG